jgi:hypothetical protein
VRAEHRHPLPRARVGELRRGGRVIRPPVDAPRIAITMPSLSAHPKARSANG